MYYIFGKVSFLYKLWEFNLNVAQKCSNVQRNLIHFNIKKFPHYIRITGVIREWEREL